MLIASTIGEIIGAILGFAFLLGLSMIVPAARRRSPRKDPEREEHNEPIEAGGSSSRYKNVFIPTCDICGSNSICHYVKLRLERRDFNVFNVTIYKRTIEVKVCDECQNRMEEESSRCLRLGVISLFAGIVFGCGSIYLLLQIIGVEGNILSAVFVLGGLFGVLIGIVAYWIFKSKKSVVSYMNTWQMKDLSKDAWRIIGVRK